MNTIISRVLYVGDFFMKKKRWMDSFRDIDISLGSHILLAVYFTSFMKQYHGRIMGTIRTKRE